MSTFDGIVHEFPDIRIDFFRGLDRRPPLACFLSHVHSDHLAGLDKLRSPFVYCSAATREILLRLEKHPCRLNYARGILEDPRLQTYKHLARVLKPIPLDTPAEIELKPGHNIQVTLIDANHCAGSVMFLIEGDGKAVLCTGDIRSEPWWVNSIARNPSMVEYSTGLKTLDRIYLDTSMLDDFQLQTKAEGLRELLKKVCRYPKDTIFHMQAWTYGYEEVWVALSKALNSKIHVDKYKMGVYKSLVTKSSDKRFAAQTHLTKDAPYLVGFTCGNNQYDGCLTLDEDVRIHSCEKGTSCSIMETKPIVFIQPIVAHLENGRDMVEVGIGGGADDLTQKPSLQLDDILTLIEIIRKNEKILGEFGTEIKDFLKMAVAYSGDVSLDVDISSSAKDESIVDILNSLATKISAIRNPTKKPEENEQDNVLPKKITFPYARHSSLPELRHLVETLRPKDIWPCTVDLISWERRGITMEKLFGDCCTGKVFLHDLLMEQIREKRRDLEEKDEQEEGQPETQPTTTAHLGPRSSPPIPSTDIPEPYEPDGDISTPIVISPPKMRRNQPRSSTLLPDDNDVQTAHDEVELPSSLPRPASKRDYEAFQGEQDTEDSTSQEGDNLTLQDSQTSTISDHAYETRLRAFQAARANMEGDEDWRTFDLISTTGHHSTLEPELGST
ncbi:Metallo-hydrolase/oxidoreductase [Hypoxylon rubiginosum]|uniref:Metallo-hydrolase/oxidoreductase n=1 Tax=Hypoxylon rubiginosum TaxID=110542 RepID=A0ACB9YGW3_9PEZI|nr:Metallo-hydrolase/oxidoreductase [Hypoxylon rubiginosum]